jgi:hypothetical protein
VWACAFVAALIGLIALAGQTASGAIFAMSVVGQYICNATVIVCRFFGGSQFTPGPFYLGVLVSTNFIHRCEKIPNDPILIERTGINDCRIVHVLDGVNPSLPLQVVRAPSRSNNHELYRRSNRRGNPLVHDILFLPRRGRKTLVQGSCHNYGR